jgi:hypothetical protein
MAARPQQINGKLHTWSKYRTTLNTCRWIRRLSTTLLRLVHFRFLHPVSLLRKYTSLLYRVGVYPYLIPHSHIYVWINRTHRSTTYSGAPPPPLLPVAQNNRLLRAYVCASDIDPGRGHSIYRYLLLIIPCLPAQQAATGSLAINRFYTQRRPS